MPSIPPVIVKAVCDYQLFSEVDGDRWFQKIMEQANDPKSFLQWSLLNVEAGNFGIQLLTFTVEMEVPARLLIDTAETRNYIERMMGDFFYDTDVSVRMLRIKIKE